MDIISGHLEAAGAFVARPAQPGRYPGVLVGAELFGVTAQVRGFAERLAQLGYVVAAPNFYHRFGVDIALPETPEGRERGFELLTRLTREDVLDDLNAAAEELIVGYGVNGRIGMVGFSLGGHIAYLAATQLRLAATAVFYPGWLTTTDISLSRPEPTVTLTSGIAKGGGRLLLLLAERDHVVPAEQRQELAEELAGAGAHHEIVVYPGAQHAYFFPGRDTYDRAAAEESWRRVTALFADELLTPSDD